MKYLLIIACLVVSTVSHTMNFQLFEEDGKVGLKNENGVVVLPPSFEALGWSDGSFSVIGEITGYKLQGNWGLINLKKEFITKAEFESLVYSGADRVVAVKKVSLIARKTGSLTLHGEVTIPFQYDAIKIHGLRAVVINKAGVEFQFGLTDLNNKVIIPGLYPNIYPVSSSRYAVANKSGKIALFSDAGKQTTEFFIDSISPFHRNYAIIHSEGWKGIINRDGMVVADPQYSDVRFNPDGSVQALSRDHWKILDDRNQLSKMLQADNLRAFQNESYCVTRAGKIGVVNKDMQEIWPFEYQYIGAVVKNKVVVKKNGKWGLLSSDRVEVIPFQYDSLLWDGEFATTLTYDVGKPRWWLVNTDTNSKSYKGYDAITRRGDIFQVKRNGFVGLIAIDGKEFVHCVYDSILEISNNQIAVQFKNQYGVISKSEQWILAPQPFSIQLVNDSLYLQREGKTTYLKSYQGDLIYFTEYALSVEPFYLLEKSAIGELKRVDFNGVHIKSFTEGVAVRGLPLEVEFHDGLRIFTGQGKFGFKDNRGLLRIPNRYDSVKEFSGERAAFKLLGRWGYLDTEDNMIVHPTYDHAGEFIDGFAIVSRNNKTGLIDKSGNVTLSVQYDSVVRMDGFLMVVANGKFGLARPDGKLLIEPRFEYLRVQSNGQVIVGSHNRYGVISSDGLSVIPITYSSIEYDSTKNLYLAHLPSEWTTLKLPKNE